MRIVRLNLEAYGRCRDVCIEIGDRVTVVVGANEAGKSTALDALTDLLWGIPTRSSRAFDFSRQQLRIGAAMDIDGEIETFTRKSTGLFKQEDLINPVSPPWDPTNALSREWWRTRLGINHDDLRIAGRGAFEGNGDLAEIIFAAREGRSGKAILEQLTADIERLYKPHGGARSVLLRVAEKNYQAAKAELQSNLTSADKVVAQRTLVKSLEKEHREAGGRRNEAARYLKTALEDQRIIEAVLRLNQARRDLASIEAEGERLSPSEWAEYLQANASLTEAARRTDRLDAAIKGKESDIAALSVNDRLLDDKATIERLQPETQARIADLRRADQEFGPAAADQTSRLKDLLRSIGIEVADNLDEAVNNASIRADHAATLNDLADRIEAFDRERGQAQEKRDGSMADLSSKGFNVDLSSAQIPRLEGISALREKLTAARDDASTAQALMDTARQATNDLRASAPTPVEPPSLTHGDVVTARRDRDENWRAIRRSWLSGELPAADGRYTLATELETSILHADDAADDEAAERSRVATQDAISGAHVEGLEAARETERTAHADLRNITQECTGLEAEWDALWSEIGVTPAPTVATSSAIAELIIAAHLANQKASSAEKELAKLTQSWSAAVGAVGLHASDTTSAWRKQCEVLREIESTQLARSDLMRHEADARRKWDAFAAEAIELLGRHAAAVDGTPISPNQIEQALTKLAREIGESVEANAKRTAYLGEVEEKSAARAEAQQELEAARETISRLAKLHGLDSEDDLICLVERSQRAADPLDRESRAHDEIRIGLDGGSDPAAAVDRLIGRDQISVNQSAEEAQASATESEQEAERVLSELTTARNALAFLENAPSAAELEAEVAARQAEVAQLTEEWALLTLQKELLTRALADLGSRDTRPLLEQAGKILDELTEGRWVALDAEDAATTRKLVVIRSDAERFGTEELSEGTVDQSFLALRLAAVAELHAERIASGEPALPLVLDDVLMTFDEVRTERALAALSHLPPGLQVIIFTHHQFVGDAVAQSDWATVSRLPEPSSVDSSVDSRQLRIRITRDVPSGAAGQRG